MLTLSMDEDGDVRVMLGGESLVYLGHVDTKRAWDRCPLSLRREFAELEGNWGKGYTPDPRDEWEAEYRAMVGVTRL